LAKKIAVHYARKPKNLKIWRVEFDKGVLLIVGNFIGMHSKEGASGFKMSNGSMNVLLTLLGLSGSELAVTQKEKEIILWLVEHDQEVRGLGNSGFDIDEMPWELETYEMEKEFLIRVICGAKKKIGWDKLDYAPNMEIMDSLLDGFYDLINNFSSENINTHAYSEWLNEAAANPVFINPHGFPKCKKHGILLYWHGCIACNDK
jgi:hypothetical protein